MKRLKIYLMIAVITAFLTANTYIFAEEYDSDSIYDILPEILTEDFDISDSSKLIENGNAAIEALSPSSVTSYSLSLIKGILTGYYRPLLIMTAIIFVSSVIGVFRDNLSSGGDLLEYSALACTIIAAFTLVRPLISAVSTFISRYVAFMTSMIGTMALLLSSSGGAVSALTTSSASAYAIGVTQIFSSGVIVPCVKIIVALSAIGALSKNVDLSGITSFIKSFCTWGIGVLFAVFGGLHSVTVKIASSADSLAMRSIRFTSAKLIPVAGNMVSESLKSVIAGINMIKSVTGGFGIAYVLYTVIPPLCSVLIVKFIILACSFLAKLVGEKKHAAFLDGVGGALNVLLACVIFASVSGILIFAVFISTAINV